MRKVHLPELNESFVLLADVFRDLICKKCRWSPADFYFHLHNPGHLRKKEIRKIHKAARTLLIDMLQSHPSIQ